MTLSVYKECRVGERSYIIAEMSRPAEVVPAVTLLYDVMTVALANLFFMQEVHLEAHNNN